MHRFNLNIQNNKEVLITAELGKMKKKITYSRDYKIKQPNVVSNNRNC